MEHRCCKNYIDAPSMQLAACQAGAGAPLGP
jgi:hypothetical protein